MAQHGAPSRWFAYPSAMSSSATASASSIMDIYIARIFCRDTDISS